MSLVFKFLTLQFITNVVSNKGQCIASAGNKLLTLENNEHFILKVSKLPSIQPYSVLLFIIL